MVFQILRNIDGPGVGSHGGGNPVPRDLEDQWSDLVRKLSGELGEYF